MYLPELPTDMLAIIAQKLGQYALWRLGAILRTGPIDRDVVYSYEVLKDANIDDLCKDTDKILLDGLNRNIFVKCLAAGNPKSIYYEAIRLVTEQQDISATIELLEWLVPFNANATYLCGMFCVCAGRTEHAAKLLKLCVDVYAKGDFDELYTLGEGVMDTVVAFYAPMNNSFASTWKYPDCPDLPFPNCAIEHEYQPGCENCYLYWCASRVYHIT